ncbi:PepSY-associated TM helix domain-containing protein [Bacteroides nordii]|uniref:PepSY-associated TM helix domain-containing protein n=1 Tax=Bacteroides nordii TaxID=291645 RepID=UPI0034A1704B
MKKIFRQIHLWLSIPFGLIITVICFSGAALVFENEIMELCRHDFYYVSKVEETPLPAGELAQKVAATLPDSISVTGISISSDPAKAYQVNLSKPRRASVYIDQYTGEIKGKYERAPFFTTMFKLHRWLLDSMKPDGGIFWGKIIIGVSTLMFVFVLISGIIIWIPRSAKALKNSFKISVNKGWKRFWYDLHIAGGLYTFIFLLALSLTGLTWSFSWYRTGFFKVFGVKMQEKGEWRMENGEGKKRDMIEKERSEKEGENKKGRNQRKGETQSLLPSQFSPLPSPYALWQKVYEQLKVQNPDYKQITVSNGTANVSFNRFGNQRASDRYSFNPRNGEITETTLYKDLDNSGKIRGWIFSVHVGSWGGMFTRILSFIASLLGATLPLTGYYLWIKKEIARSAREKRKGG